MRKPQSKSANALPQGQPEKLWLEVHEVAALLSIGVRTVWRMVEQGSLPQPQRFTRKLVRWNRAAILEWAARLQEQNAEHPTPPTPSLNLRVPKPEPEPEPVKPRKKKIAPEVVAGLVDAVERDGRSVKDAAALFGLRTGAAYRLLYEERVKAATEGGAE